MPAATKTFRVFLRGENFLLESEGAVRRFGFYTTQFVKASNEAEAERLAVEALCQSDRLRVLNDRSDPPMLFAEEIAALSSIDAVESREPGLVFYEDRPVAH